ncbi:uncharacterized protein LOC120335711 [Styela clava]|uniref:uncharacterized protein LOC120335711 n=1 Tax=Styela clava TaxID=7725 RepID=UPI0019394EFC|nr:uncharacterized protein LOC120335711 [Styela clava]
MGILRKGILQLQQIFHANRRGISEYAKKYGQRIGDQELKPRLHPVSLTVQFGIGALLLKHVVDDRKEHYKVFTENYEEGREYLKNTDSLNRFLYKRYPEVDKFLENKVGNIDFYEPTNKEIFIRKDVKITNVKDP